MAQNKNWFVHIGGEIFGPVSSDVVNVMLRQTRLQFTDFIWSAGHTKWVRIIDVDDFAGLLPVYPRTAIPSGVVGKATKPEPVVEVEEVEEVEKEEVVEEVVEEIVEPVKLKAKKKTPEIKPEPRTGTLVPNKADVKPGSKLSVFPRIKLTGKINIEGGSSFKIIDISEGGVFVAAKDCIEIGTEVSFTLESNLFVEILPMKGVVIRHGDRYDESGFAIEFLRVNPIYKRMIQSAISKESKAS